MGCPTCDKNFAQLIERYLNNKDVRFLITATGGTIDIKPFNPKLPNVFYDQNVENTRYRNIFDSTAVFFIKGKEIDTAITISPENIEAQLKYISHSIGK